MASIQTKKSKRGKKTYYVVVCFAEKHKWIRAGTLVEARKLKKHIESLEQSQRLEKLGLTAQAIRVDDFFQDYADHVRLRTSPGTVKRYLAVLNTFLTFLKMFHPNIRYLSQIKPEHIESYQKERLESVELKTEADGDREGTHKNKRLPLPQTVNYEVGILRSAFLWAKDHEWIPVVPTAKVKRLRSLPTRKAKILSAEHCKTFLETARVMAKADQQMGVYYRAFKFLLNTGLRSSELCHLTWEDIDLDTGLIRIQAKDGWSPKTYAREFFLNETSVGLLKSLRDGDGIIFKDHKGRKLDNDRLRRALIKIASAAGFRDFTRVHDLRHTFNSLMQMNGVDPATMGKILGHKDIETTMIYTHQTHEHLKRSIEKLKLDEFSKRSQSVA